MASSRAISSARSPTKAASTAKLIGRIEIFDDYTVLDMPADLPADLMEHLQNVRVAGQALRIRPDDGSAPAPSPSPSPAPQRASAPRAPQAGGALAPYRIAVGHQHGVKPGNIVGAIANELGLDAKLIGRIEIEDDYSLIDLPADLSDDLLAHLQGVRVAGQALRAQPVGAQAERPRQQPAARLDAIPFDQAPPPVAEAKPKREREKAKDALPVKTYRIEVGHAHEAKPANIVGAIANEAGLEARYIGRIDIYDDHSLIDLPDGMPKELLQHLKSVWVAGQQLKISPADAAAVAARKPALTKAPGKKERKKY
jgi:ATP-dependent RNA helicase DeaD